MPGVVMGSFAKVEHSFASGVRSSNVEGRCRSVGRLAPELNRPRPSRPCHARTQHHAHLQGWLSVGLQLVGLLITWSNSHLVVRWSYVWLDTSSRLAKGDRCRQLSGREMGSRTQALGLTRVSLELDASLKLNRSAT